jgi:hypothetical protein
MVDGWSPTVTSIGAAAVSALWMISSSMGRGAPLMYY